MRKKILLIALAAVMLFTLAIPVMADDDSAVEEMRTEELSVFDADLPSDADAIPTMADDDSADEEMITEELSVFDAVLPSSADITADESLESIPAPVVTVNFPGVEGVTVSVWAFGDGPSRRWITLGTFDDTSGPIEVPESTTIVRAQRGSMTYQFSGLVFSAGDNDVFDVPVIELEVTGLLCGSARVGITVAGGNWIFNTAAVVGTSATYNVFDTGNYAAVLDNTGFFGISRVAARNGDKLLVDFSDLYYSITIPEGMSRVSIAIPGQNFIVTNAQAGREIWLLKVERMATINFRLDSTGTTNHSFEFFLDGSNPFEGTLVMIDFPGVEGVAIDFMRLGTSSWNTSLGGGHSNRAIFNIPEGQTLTSILLRRGAQVRFDGLENYGRVIYLSVPTGTIGIIQEGNQDNFSVMLGSSWTANRREPIGLFDVEGGYTVRLNVSVNGSGGNRHPITINNVPAGTIIDRSDFVHTVFVPGGISNLAISGNVLNRRANAAGTAVELPISGATVTMSFDIVGASERQYIDIVLDGSNPFAGTLVIIDFPGVQSVAVEYFRNGSGTPIRVPDTFNDRIVFNIPEGETLNALRLTRGAQVRFSGLNGNAMAYYFNVPVGTISVNNMVGNDGAFQVLLGSSWANLPNPVTLFDIEGGYSVRFGVSLNGSGGNRHQITVSNVMTGNPIDRNLYVHSVIVPEGVTGVGITSVGANSQIHPSGRPFNAGDMIELPISHRNATMTLTFEGKSQTIDFVLDGNNPFDDFMIP